MQRSRSALPVLRLSLVALAITALGGARAGQTKPAAEALAVEINAYGCLTAVPPAGLRNVDGPRVELLPGFAEWFGIDFDTAGRRVRRVGPGSAPDWADRVLVERVASERTADGVVVHTRAATLAIETRFTFEDDGPLLAVQVELTNTGRHWARNVIYTREWRTPGRAGWTFPDDLPVAGDAPPDVARMAYMADDIPPGATQGFRFSFTGRGIELGSGLDVPLRLWRSAAYPDGLVFGETNGVSWGDFDADGFIDVFACQSGNLWRNLGGTDWELTADLDVFLPAANRRYGSSFGDYDGDGKPDLGTEPRLGFGGDGCFHLLHNLGMATFVDVAEDPALVDALLCGLSETICWGDTDDDGDLDMFLPVYPPWAFNGPGNFFLENLGPTGPGGQFRFTETSAAAGLDNPPPNSARPEGAQFCDVDFDGDIDLYSNGHLYQNQSTTTPSFAAMTETASGIGLSTRLDEGAMLFDYDLDGDYDLAIVYTSGGVKIWESFGDGNFFDVEAGVIQNPGAGLDLGMSAEDWDNDGDIDFSTRHVFRRNMLVEQGIRHFAVATLDIPIEHRSSATPAWGDWDEDGDLDCALGNWLRVGRLYENVTADDVPPEQRTHVRVRVVRDSDDFDPGLETEYGASVEVRVAGDGFRRKKFVASSHGYINQNEYTLHFALPPGADPAAPTAGVRFDVSVDFPGRPDRGILRVDRHVNPALGAIRLADLAEREIVVYRSGRVRIDGADLPAPADAELARLTTTPLALPTPTAPLAAPVAAPGPEHWAGIALHVDPLAPAQLVKELVIDGQLAPPVRCDAQQGAAAGPLGPLGVEPDLAGRRFNVALWDVSEPGKPRLVHGLARATSSRNRRTSFPVAIRLAPGHTYRLVAHLAERRASPLTARTGAPVQVLGGLGFTDPAPCTGAAVDAAPLDATQGWLALRYTHAPRAALRGGGRTGTLVRALDAALGAL